MKTSVITYLAAVTFATFQQLFAKYIFDAWDFAIFLAIMVCVDTITGIWAAAKRNDLHSSPFGKVFTKTVLYALFLVVLHGLKNHTSNVASYTVFDWLNTVGYAALIGREALSVVENITKIKPDLFPKFLLKKLRHYDQNGYDSNSNGTDNSIL